MPISVHAVTPDFVAEIGDVALDKPLAPDDLAAIRTAFTKYAILIFPDQEFDDESQLAFARNFGPLETTVFKARKDHKLRLHENMADVGNLDSENRVLAADNRQRLYNLGNRLWHTDSSFKRLPAYCSMLHARSIPPIGGQTEYADTRAAYDALAQALLLQRSDVSASRMFGVDCLLVGRKLFALFQHDSMMFKLEGNEHHAALALPGAQPHDRVGVALFHAAQGQADEGRQRHALQGVGRDLGAAAQAEQRRADQDRRQRTGRGQGLPSVRGVGDVQRDQKSDEDHVVSLAGRGWGRRREPTGPERRLATHRRANQGRRKPFRWRPLVRHLKHKYKYLK